MVVRLQITNAKIPVAVEKTTYYRVVDKQPNFQCEQDR